jgi:hypothetical protein
MSASPDGHEEIGLESLAENLKIKDGALYWKGKRLATVVELRLSLTQKIVGGVLSFLVGMAAIAGPLIQYLADLDSICKNTHDFLILCPVTVDTPKTSSGGKSTPATPPAIPSTSEEMPQPQQ